MNTTHVVIVFLAIIVLILIGMAIYNLSVRSKNKSVASSLKGKYLAKFPATPSS